MKRSREAATAARTPAAAPAAGRRLSAGGAFVLNARGEVTHFIKSAAGSTVTNVAYRHGTSKLVMTESESGSILEADLPAAGAALFSHK